MQGGSHGKPVPSSALKVRAAGATAPRPLTRTGSLFSRQLPKPSCSPCTSPTAGEHPFCVPGTPSCLSHLYHKTQTVWREVESPVGLGPSLHFCGQRDGSLAERADGEGIYGFGLPAVNGWMQCSLLSREGIGGAGAGSEMGGRCGGGDGPLLLLFTGIFVPLDVIVTERPSGGHCPWTVVSLSTGEFARGRGHGKVKGGMERCRYNPGVVKDAANHRKLGQGRDGPVLTASEEAGVLTAGLQAVGRVARGALPWCPWETPQPVCLPMW